MPIRPDLMSLYPGGSIRSAEWLAIRADVLRRAKYRCQVCSVPDRTVAFVYRDGQDAFDTKTIDFLGHRHAPSKVELVTVILSVAHLDHDPTNNRSSNLRALCQRCHLLHDIEHHQHTRRTKNAIRDLFEGQQPCRP